MGSFQFVPITNCPRQTSQVTNLHSEKQIEQRHRNTEGTKYLCQESMGALKDLNFTQHFPFFQSMPEKQSENKGIRFYVLSLCYFLQD